jgi:hypothetical protein
MRSVAEVLSKGTAQFPPRIVCAGSQYDPLEKLQRRYLTLVLR